MRDWRVYFSFLVGVGLVLLGYSVRAEDTTPPKIDLTLIAKTGFAAGYCYATLGEGDEKGAAKRVGLSVADFRAYCNNSTNTYNRLTE